MKVTEDQLIKRLSAQRRELAILHSKVNFWKAKYMEKYWLEVAKKGFSERSQLIEYIRKETRPRLFRRKKK